MICDPQRRVARALDGVAHFRPDDRSQDAQVLLRLSAHLQQQGACSSPCSSSTICSWDANHDKCLQLPHEADGLTTTVLKVSSVYSTYWALVFTGPMRLGALPRNTSAASSKGALLPEHTLPSEGA
jgi:hypothetical protein